MKIYVLCDGNESINTLLVFGHYERLVDAKKACKDINKDYPKKDWLQIYEVIIKKRKVKC